MRNKHIIAGFLYLIWIIGFIVILNTLSRLEATWIQEFFESGEQNKYNLLKSGLNFIIGLYISILFISGRKLEINYY